jgi:hypothetical protein
VITMDDLINNQEEGVEETRSKDEDDEFYR